MTRTINPSPAQIIGLAAAHPVTSLVAARAALKAAGYAQTAAADVVAASARLSVARNRAPLRRIARHLGYTPIQRATFYAAGLRQAPTVWSDAPAWTGQQRSRWDWREPVHGTPAAKPAHILGASGTPAERLQRVRVANVQHQYHCATRVGKNDRIEVHLTTDPAAVGVQQAESVDWDTYRGAYKGWACKSKTHHITVPADWRVRVQRRGLGVVDGMMTLDAAPLEGQPDGVDLYAASWVHQGRGNVATTVRGYIARTSGLTYHGATPDAALAGLRRKIDGAQWAATLATADLAGLIDGHQSLPVRVSDARAIGACEYGIRSWCRAVGLPYEQGHATLQQVHDAYTREPRPEARAAMLHALRRARALMRAA